METRPLAFALCVALGCQQTGFSLRTPPAPVTLEGVAQKGPFTAGADLLVSQLDRYGQITDMLARTTTKSDLGDFEVKVPYAASAAIEVQATGQYFDELWGRASTTPVTLHALAQLGDAGRQTVRVNALTELAHLRARTLMSGGATLSDALQQAEAEVVRALPLHAGAALGAASTLDLLGDDSDGNAYLFALSCTLDQSAADLGMGATDPALAALLGTLAADLEGDGMLQPQNTAALAGAYQRFDVQSCADQLTAFRTAHGISAPVPSLDRAFDWDGDGISDFDDHDDDGDGIVDRDDKVVSVSASYAITGEGQVWDLFDLRAPVPMPGKPKQIVDLGASVAGAILLEDGTVWQFDAGMPPTRAGTLTGVTWLATASGYFTAVDGDGVGWFIGTATMPPSTEPSLTDLTALVGDPLGFRLLLKKDGTVLEDGPFDCGPSPHPIAGLPPAVAIGGVPGFNETAVALDAGGTLWRWTRQCETDHFVYTTTPITTGVAAVSFDGINVLAKDGTIFTLQSGTPALYSGVHTAIAIGDGSAVALSDGSVVFASVGGATPVRIPR